ncbi:hypothetical protein [Comamonas sp. JC664]|uniref:hypothetical protein n=1 Tax=Comamonas sp. JC664 TaxID=2801917 RepID=UPI0017491F1E|nr:hypothetical protein [Comamonas sp. JC664]MBL0693528.1 hypothetical protein [Comamonas sp. JC664]GHG73012.1 hypothetical protein GCM10012319_19480 [Comamonas sp. KCTC 72670]
MRRFIGSAVLATGLLTGCGPSETETSTQQPAEQQQAPLTETDVDLAPECRGVLDYLNESDFDRLDAALPSNVAHNLIAARPFSTVAQVAAVKLVGEARLHQIVSAARGLDYIEAECYGIFDNLALSKDDADAIVSLVNSISATELHDILPDARTGATNLRNLRPFATVDAIANTSGIGVVSLRNLRNAATLSRPFEALIDAVNTLPQPNHGTNMARHFDWLSKVNSSYFHFQLQECFGIRPQLLPDTGGGTVLRPNLADGAEVYAAVENGIAYAENGIQEKVDPQVKAAGLANLAALTSGRSFFGCQYGYANDPWSDHGVKFFVDAETGFSVYVDTFWVE